MVKRALCVGCTYPGRVIKLGGAVSDAFWMGKTLQGQFDFDEIMLLHDVELPSAESNRQIRNQNPDTLPTRVNIFEGLRWLVDASQTGDVLVFHFSGFGIEVDDQDGWDGEGYSEALLPTDYEDGAASDEFAVILMEEIRDILTSAPPGCHVICVMDCDHSNTACDPLGVSVSKPSAAADASSNLSMGAIAGLMQSSILCGMFPTQTLNVKMTHSEHNRSIWASARARELNVKARWQPQVGISSPKIGPYPHRATLPRSFPTCFCYSASNLHQTSLEMKFADLGRVHGVLTYSFIRALEKLKFAKGTTHEKLAAGISEEMHEIRRTYLPDMDQSVLLTMSKPFADSCCMQVFQPILPDMVPPPLRGTPAFRRIRWPQNVNSSAAQSTRLTKDETIKARLNLHDFSGLKLGERQEQKPIVSAREKVVSERPGMTILGSFWSAVVGFGESEPNSASQDANSGAAALPSADAVEPAKHHKKQQAPVFFYSGDAPAGSSADTKPLYGSAPAAPQTHSGPPQEAASATFSQQPADRTYELPAAGTVSPMKTGNITPMGGIPRLQPPVALQVPTVYAPTRLQTQAPSAGVTQSALAGGLRAPGLLQTRPPQITPSRH